MVFMFALMTVIIYGLITVGLAMTKEQRWSFLKKLIFSLTCATLSVIILVAFVLIF
jgi:hypothetical protein